MKPLSERLLEAADWEIHMPTELREWLEEAAALAKSVESAPARTVLYMHQAGGLVCYVSLPENMAGQRVALVPLPQQSET